MERADAVASRYRKLDVARITATLDRLTRRIGERFPESGLHGISQELAAFASESTARIRRIERPHWPRRVAIVATLLGLAVIVVAATAKVRVALTVPGISDLAQGIEAAVNDVIYLGVGIYFLVSLETRSKRRAALSALHELRSIVHIIDMHQLTKDPEELLNEGTPTESSPTRAMNRFEVARYLDYCSELLSLASKLAALYVQQLNDSVVLAAVNDIESLAGDLSAKIWQKIMIIDMIAPKVRKVAEDR
jgi:hypothetical protein